MKKVWIVVANGSQAKVFKAENLQQLTELKSFDHPESHLKREDLLSDRPGRMTQRGIFSADTMQEKTSQKVKEATHFADEIAQFLYQGYNAGECEKLYLIAKPPFLGHLHHALDTHVAKLIESEIHKDLTHLRAEEIREYLPPIL